MRIVRLSAGMAVVVLSLRAFQAKAEKPLLTLDEFFNSVEIGTVKISPDGRAVVIETHRADWDGNRFQSDLWLYRDDGDTTGTVIQLTASGHDWAPEWSPDGRWIAFLSDRRPASLKDRNARDEEAAKRAPRTRRARLGKLCRAATGFLSLNVLTQIRFEIGPNGSEHGVAPRFGCCLTRISAGEMSKPRCS